MKKLFLSLMLVAGLAAGFTSCKKDDKTNESTDHTQTFTLGEDEYDIDNVIIIQNIQYKGQSGIYCAMVLEEGQLVGDTGGEGQGIVMIFEGDGIAADTYTFNADPQAFPQYYFADLSIDDVMNFDLNAFLQDNDMYRATEGACTIEISDSKYIVTTSNITVTNTEDSKTSSVDYEGSAYVYTLATVESGELTVGDSTSEVATAGTTKYQIAFVGKQIVSFITESGQMFGFIAPSVFGDNLPTGDLEVSMTKYWIFYLENLQEFQDIANHIITTGSIHVEYASKSDAYYDITIETTDNGMPCNLTYRGTVPYYDLPIQQ